MKILSVAATISSVALVIVALTMSYALVAPVDVIDDETWTITYDKSTYRVGDKATLTSKFTKLRDIDGTATRFISCKSPDNVFIKYKLNNDVAIAPQGKAGVGIIVTIPQELAGITLPTDCRFTIRVDYNINFFRTHTESTTSSEFVLYPKSDTSNSTSSTIVNPNGTSTTTNTESNSSTTPMPAPQPAAVPEPVKPAPQSPTQPAGPILGIPLIDGIIKLLGGN